MPEKTVGSLNGQALRWAPGDPTPHVDLPDGRRYVHGLPLGYAEVFTGIPELQNDAQCGAIARWGAVFYLNKDGSWQANGICGTWCLETAP